MCGKRLLVVEDDIDFRQFMVEILSDEGFDVVQAEDGEHAVEILEHIDQLDVLVTDIEMPGRYNGNMVAVIAKDHHPALSVIYVSGHPESVTNRIGASETFIEKPFRSIRMVTEIRRLMHIAEARI